MTSICRTRAAERAIAADGTQSLGKGLCQEGRTEGNAKRRAGGSEVILQLVVQKAKDSDEEVKEDPDEEKKALSTLVDHPAVPFLPERFRLVDHRSYRDGGIESLEALEAATFRLVALEVCWLGGISIVSGLSPKGSCTPSEKSRPIVDIIG